MANYDVGGEVDKLPKDEKVDSANSEPAAEPDNPTPQDNAAHKAAPNGGNGDNAAARKTGQPVDANDDEGVPVELRRIGIAIGVLMVAGGFAVVFFSARLYGIAILLICVGFGIELTAFGSKAAGRIFKFNVLGGGALAIALYLLVYNFPVRPTDNYVKGKIEHTRTFEQVVGSAKERFFVGRPHKEADFGFIIFEPEIDSDQLYFQFDFPVGAPVKELYIGCIDTGIARQLMGTSEALVLTLEERNGQYRLLENKNAKQIGQINKTLCDGNEAVTIPAKEISLWNGLIGTAFAQDSELDRTRRAIASLDATDGTERDAARTEIGQLTTQEAFQLVADTWDISASSYRSDLGRLVGWSTAIARNREMAVFIAQSLSRAQLDYLVQLTGQGDFTLRQFSTEVLHRLLETTSWSSGPTKEKARELIDAVASGLTDPEFQPVEKTAVDFSAERRFYNTLISIEFSGCNIGKDYRADLLSQLSQAVTQIKDAPTRLKTFHKAKEIREGMAACKNEN